MIKDSYSERMKDVITVAKFLLVYNRELPAAEWGNVQLGEAIESFARIVEFDKSLLTSLVKTKEESEKLTNQEG